MSHEDLQQFAKKQMTMLKNLKNKTDVVTKERDSMKTELSKTKEDHELGFRNPIDRNFCRKYRVFFGRLRIFNSKTFKVFSDENKDT